LGEVPKAPKMATFFNETAAQPAVRVAETGEIGTPFLF
jgi:hypothetical protein